MNFPSEESKQDRVKQFSLAVTVICWIELVTVSRHKDTFSESSGSLNTVAYALALFCLCAQLLVFKQSFYLNPYLCFVFECVFMHMHIVSSVLGSRLLSDYGLCLSNI